MSGMPPVAVGMLADSKARCSCFNCSVVLQRVSQNTLAESFDQKADQGVTTESSSLQVNLSSKSL